MRRVHNTQRQDFAPLQLKKNVELAQRAYADIKEIGSLSRQPNFGVPTGLLDQAEAVKARRWYEKALKRVVRRHQRGLHRRGISFRTVFLTVVLPSGAVSGSHLAETKVNKLRDAMQRYARALPPDSFFAGMLEADHVVDQCAGVDHWQWHGHFIAVVPCRTLVEARKLVHLAFPVRRNPALGIYRPVKVEGVRQRRGGLQGVIRYSSKSLQIHAVHRKSVTLNVKTNRRGEAQRQDLSHRERAVWAGFAAHADPYGLMVWSGYRRYGRNLRPAVGHGGGGRRITF